MKKKLYAIFALLIICLSPIMFLTGCKSENDTKYVELAGLTDQVILQYKVGDKDFTAAQEWSGFKLTVYSATYDPDKGNYGEYVKDEKPIVEATTFEEAAKAGLKCVGGLTTTTKTSTDPSSDDYYRTLVLMYGGNRWVVKYQVSEQ